MKKVIILLLIVVPAFLYGQQTVEERRQINEKNIRQVIESRADWQDGQWSAGNLHSFKKYDENGNLTLTGKYAADGTPINQNQWNYNENNRQVSRLAFCEETGKEAKENVCMFFRNYTFDEQGNVTRSEGFAPDSTRKVQILFQRNKQGHPIERWYLHKDKDKSVYYRYAYNDRGDATIKTSANLAGQLLHEEKIRYDYSDLGLKQKAHISDHKNVLVEIRRYEYDMKGNLKEILIMDPQEKPIRKRVFEYLYY